MGGVRRGLARRSDEGSQEVAGRVGQPSVEKSFGCTLAFSA